MPTIATFNINSINARLPNLLAWLDAAQPDMLCLQELKCVDAAFPGLELGARGYQILVHGQKSYNGVAILAKSAIENVVIGLPGDLEDEQARYVEATIAGFRLASIYLPNGNPAPGPKLDYKLGWMARLLHHAEQLLRDERPVVLAGDFNIIPAPADVHDPVAWEGDALYRPETRRAFRSLINLGLTDSFRALHPGERGAYSFWDYQGGALQLDHGIRIDHLLTNGRATDLLDKVWIDKAPRHVAKASDHTPVLASFRAP